MLLWDLGKRVSDCLSKCEQWQDSFQNLALGKSNFAAHTARYADGPLCLGPACELFKLALLTDADVGYCHKGSCTLHKDENLE